MSEELFIQSAEELWDEKSEIIDDNFSSMDRWVGTEVINKRDFMLIISKLIESDFNVSLSESEKVAVRLPIGVDVECL